MTMQTNESDSNNNSELNFWEPRQYRRTVKRIDNANKLCSQLIFIIQERSNIEKGYAANLRKFALRVDDIIKSNAEYGTVNNVLYSLSKEAGDSAELHSNISSDLTGRIQQGIKNWQKEKFHKSSIPPSLKEANILLTQFENAQKPWCKKLKHAKQCKSHFYDAQKLLRSAEVRFRNAKNDPSGTPEQLSRLEEKLEKTKEDEKNARKAYEEAIQSLVEIIPSYMEAMTQVFNKAQAFERECIHFFKQQALLVHEVLDIASTASLPKIFADMRETISKVDAEADLKRWSLEHGVDMPFNIPKFEEYSPELCSLGGKGKSILTDGNNTGVTLTSVNFITSPDRPNNGTGGGVESGSTSSPIHTIVYNSSMNGAVANTNQPAADNVAPYLDLVDDGRPGIPIRALYDYVGAEADELSFNMGDLFEKLEDEDEQGWCKGRKDGRVGLYPAKYVQVL